MVWWSAAALAVPFELSETGTSHLCWFSELEASSWNTTAGNGPGEGDHFGSDYYALDYNTDTFDADCGTLAYPVCAGTVLFAGTTDPNGDPEGPGDNGYGLQVIVQCADDPEFAFRHSHLEAVSVASGATVTLDTELGRIGNTGNSTACHDHLVVYRNLSMPSPTYPSVTGLEGLQIGRAPTSLSGAPNVFAAPYDLDADCTSPVDDVGDPALTWLPVEDLTARFGVDGWRPRLAAGPEDVHLIFPRWTGGNEIYSAIHTAGSWTRAFDIGFDDHCLEPDIAVDDDDVPHLVVSECLGGGLQGGDTVQYTTRTSRFWDPPVDLSTDGFGLRPVVAEADGVVHVVWFDDDDRALRTRRLVGGSWTPDEALTDATLDCYGVDLVAGPGGTAHLVTECRASDDIRYASFDGVSWSATELVATGMQAATYPNVGLGPDGTVHAAWEKSVNGSRTLYASRVGGTWSAWEIASGPEVARSPAMHVDADGAVHFAWQGLGSGQPYRVEYRRLDAQGWSPVYVLHETGGWTPDVDLTTDGAGAVHVVWSAQPAGRVLGYRRTTAGVDADLDGWTADDVCPDVYDPLQADADGDGMGDLCDPCPQDPAADCPALQAVLDCGAAVAAPGDVVPIDVSITNLGDQPADLLAELSVVTCNGVPFPYRAGAATLPAMGEAGFTVDARVPDPFPAWATGCPLAWRLSAYRGGFLHDVATCSFEVVP
jgi:hypothetical protein